MPKGAALGTRLAAVCTAILLLAVPDVRAADFTTATSIVTDPALPEPVQIAIIRLEGDIETGDDLRLKSQLRRIGHFNTQEGSPTSGPLVLLALDSEGGDYGAALEIVRLLNENPFPTHVGPYDQCLSACAFIFMAGHVFDAFDERMPARIMDARAVVGFHAPYDPVGTRQFVQGVQAVGDLMKAVRGLDPSLLADILAVPPDKFLHVDTVDKAGRWGVDVVGVLTPEPSVSSFWNICANMQNWRYRGERDVVWPPASDPRALAHGFPDQNGAMQPVDAPLHMAERAGHQFFTAHPNVYYAQSCYIAARLDDGTPHYWHSYQPQDYEVPEDYYFLDNDQPGWTAYDGSAELNTLPPADYDVMSYLLRDAREWAEWFERHPDRG